MPNSNAMPLPVARPKRQFKFAVSKTAPPTTTPKLAQMQGWLRWMFTQPLGIQGGLNAAASYRGVSRFREPQPRLLSFVVDGPPLSIDQRLGVYADAYFIRLLESLASDYPAVSRLLGPDRFRKLIADYVIACPSSSPSLQDVGAQLPEFIKRHGLSAAMPWLFELAVLEQKVLQTFFTDRSPVLDVSRLSSIPESQWSKACVGLDPTATFFKTEWPVYRLWKQRESSRGKRLNLPSRRATQSLLIYRDENWVQARPLQQPQWFALEQLQKGKTLGEVCRLLARRFDVQEAKSVTQWFAEWVSSGVIKRIEWGR